jgi:hypothetical protein
MGLAGRSRCNGTVFVEGVRGWENRGRMRVLERWPKVKELEHESIRLRGWDQCKRMFD